MKKAEIQNMAYSRREILQGFKFLPLLSFLPYIFLGCKKKSEVENQVLSKEVSIKGCEDKALTDNEKNIRQALKYVDNTPILGKTCDNCKLYTLPLNNSACGGCKVVPGPIHPKGYCISWIGRM